ncbi:hypothetical protein [uncultured Senegalimassilia sp.]|uniref:hypothetical protein n=1 Tax=uncultured Senegalimassilia sp. TaxID=1714350 RepID=UPI0025FCCA22|nr:hypothetical protein [uncultured Senegalimassilia sp.]
MSETNIRKSPYETNRANLREENARKNPIEQIARKNSNETNTCANPSESSARANPCEATGRKSLSERIAHANAARVASAWDAPDEQLLEAERRSPFQVCDVYCAHAEELLAITGQISAALPSRAAYLARTNPRAAAHPDNRSVKAYAQVGNPACTFVWEIRNNKEGALAKSSDAQYAKALDATDALKDLWEDEPWLDELQIAKALITQIVLLDDDLRAKVLKRANIMAKECASTLAPYLRG